jgi:6-phosphogluconolactonase
MQTFKQMSSIHRFVRSIVMSFAFLFAALSFTGALPSQPASSYFMYVGTYTEADSTSKGIYVYRFEPRTGRVTELGLAAQTTNPSFLAVHPSYRFLYAVNEIGNYGGQKSGAVSAFAIDSSTGKLTLLNQLATGGADPCYLTVDKTGKFLLVANYSGGSIAVFPILEDGRLGEKSAFIQHTGHGPNPERQEAPHAHSIDLSPDGRFAIVDDLGLDETLVYKFDSAHGTLTPNDPPFAKANPGAGPRHFTFSPNGNFGYVVNELSSDISAFSYDAMNGTFHPLQTISTIPKTFTAENTAAEIEISPSGKFLYASNRGHNSIAVFSIDPQKGTLTLLQYVPTKGESPRNFEIDPTGSLLFVGNEKSDTLVTFRVDPKSGRLTPTGKVLEISQPVCVRFVPAEAK